MIRPVPQVRARSLGANLGFLVPLQRAGVEFSYAPRSAMLPAIRAIPFPKPGLAKEPGEWKWSSFRYYSLREVGVVEIESAWTATDRERKIIRECS